jgi:hypothetical protein
MSNSTSYKASLYFNEDFLDIEVSVGGFSTEAEAEKFANSNSSFLMLQKTGLELFIEGDRYPISRDSAIVRIDMDWHTRTPLDPRDPDSMAIIMQSMEDHSQGIDNPLVVKVEDLEVVDFSFSKILDLLNAYRQSAKDEYKITECIAYGVFESIEEVGAV